ncbi:MAG: ABC transporter permease subunit [Bacteroidales bacterium]|nr:ABC transporter permease subunit [Bacteroidales bacterium]
MKKQFCNITLIFSVMIFCYACSSTTSNEKTAAQDSTANFNESNKFAGTKIAVVLGSTHDQFVTANYPDAEIIRFDNSPDLSIALKAKQCDLMLMDGFTGELYLKDDPSLAIFKENVIQEPIGFGFNDDNLCNEFNQMLSELKQSGELQSIIDKWSNDMGDAEIPDFSDVPKNGVLRLATPETNPPFCFFKNQQHAGIDLELAFIFAARLNKEISIINVPFNALMPSLSSHKVDVICSGITITEERSKQVKFSDVYYESKANLLTLKENLNPTQITNKNIYSSFSDLEGKKIAVLLGSTQDYYAAENFPKSTILRIDAISDLLMALTTNRCDAALISNEQAVFFMKTNPDFGFLKENLYNDSISMGFPKGNDAMVQKFNDFLVKIKKSGLYQQIYDRWMNDQASTMPVIENSGKNGTLNIGTEGQSVPYSYLKDGKIVGFDIELIYRFAAEIEKTPKLFTYNFSGLIPALATGKVDVIANNIMVTEERKKEVAFTNGYCIKSTGIICKKEHLSSNENINDGSNLESATIGVMTGSLAEMYLKEHYKQAKIQCFDDIMDAVTALKTNKLQYVMTAFTTTITATKNNPDLLLLPKEYTHEGAGIAFPKNSSSELLNKTNAVIKQLKEDGTLDQMIDRWTKNEGKDYEKVDVPQVKDGPVLKVGCAANREPMCFIQNKKIVGLDCELIERIAYQLGMKVEYTDMKFSALVAALTTGKVDVVISNFTATEERKEKVDFSEIYFVNPQMLLTKNNNSSQMIGQSWWSSIKESFYNNLILEQRYLLIWDGLKVTCLISLLSVILGTILGGCICFMRMSKNLILKNIAKVYIDLLRGIPQVVLLMIMFYVVFASSNITGVTVASITFALNFAAYVSEVFRTSITGVGKGQTEAGIAMGFNKVKTFINIVLPQAVQKVLPVFKGEFISLVKMTSIVGYIAVQDLTKASDIIRSRTFDAFFPLIMVAILYFVLAWVLTQLLTLIEIKTAPKRSKGPKGN